MKNAVLAALFVLGPLALRAETPPNRAKQIIDDCVQALGGDRFLQMQTRVEEGQAYSFYRESVTGLSIARIYTRYDSGVADTAHQLAQHERDNYGKKQDYGTLFTDKEAWDVTYRGARPIPADRFAQYKNTTLHDIFYILRVRLHEPGWIFEYQGADVVENHDVDIVDLTDAGNRTTTVYIDRITKLPVRQVFYRRDPITKDRDEEITHFDKYVENDGVEWPYVIQRDRNGEKIYEIFSTSVRINDPKVSDDLFTLPSDIKLLKPE
jgi:hypothetical protein